jgi:NTP pyrophosphatase (non-canonical NTP hydrolase)
MVEEKEIKETLELTHTPIDDSCEKCKEHGGTINLGWEESYKKFTRDTAQYPKEVEMEYLMIGLANEVGEVLGKFKKHMRGDKMVVEDFNNALVAEMGDVMWYYARILDVLGVSFYDVMIGNIQKLHSRMARDVIKGDGDDR